MKPLAAVAYVALVVSTLAFFITSIPLQISDGVTNMLSVADMSPIEIFREKLTNESYFRPLMWPPYRLVMDVSGGAYFEWFKGIQIGQLLVLLLFFVRWLRVRTILDLAILPFAVAVIIGGHTFAGTLLELFPINHFLAITGCCMAAATLAAEPRRTSNDLLAVVIFLYAVLTLETGLLVWVILVWAFVLGWRGVSRWAIGAVTLGIVGYICVRFVWLDTGTPQLIERSTGYGFSVLDPDELQRRFGDRPMVFYFYNVASAVSSVLFAEPRGGVWQFARGLLHGDLEQATILNVFCATGVTCLVAAYAWRRRQAWRARQLTDGDRVVLMLPAVLMANALFCYAYIKDVILSPAGVFMAGAAFVAIRDLLGRLERRRMALRTAMVTVVLGALASGWAVKHMGIHYSLRRQSINVRREWAFIDEYLTEQEVALDTPRKRAMKVQLEQEALMKVPMPPWPTLPWSYRWFDENQ